MINSEGPPGGRRLERNHGPQAEGRGVLSRFHTQPLFKNLVLVTGKTEVVQEHKTLVSKTGRPARAEAGPAESVLRMELSM
jgi:hypothetical protein